VQFPIRYDKDLENTVFIIYRKKGDIGKWCLVFIGKKTTLKNGVKYPLGIVTLENSV
jgi:hypothetical protein